MTDRNQMTDNMPERLRFRSETVDSEPKLFRHVTNVDICMWKIIAHCRFWYGNCVWDVGDNDGIPCNEENCIAYREVMGTINDGQ